MAELDKLGCVRESSFVTFSEIAPKKENESE